MTTYESDIKVINANIRAVYGKLSDLRNVDAMKDELPAEVGIKDIKCEQDSISFNVNPVGDVKLVIVEREEPKTIKFGAEKLPVQFNMWIQLIEKEENVTKMKLTIKAELPIMIKMMVGNKLKDFINKLADGLASIQY